jgi:hypothetical protein
MTEHSLPFGKHRSNVPRSVGTDYMDWMLRPLQALVALGPDLPLGRAVTVEWL